MYAHLTGEMWKPQKFTGHFNSEHGRATLMGSHSRASKTRNVYCEILCIWDFHLSNQSEVSRIAVVELSIVRHVAGIGFQRFNKAKGVAD